MTIKKATGSTSLPIALEKKPKPITAIPVVVKAKVLLKQLRLILQLEQI